MMDFDGWYYFERAFGVADGEIGDCALKAKEL
jgi:hypothetical protein